MFRTDNPHKAAAGFQGHPKFHMQSTSSYPGMISRKLGRRLQCGLGVFTSFPCALDQNTLEHVQSSHHWPLIDIEEVQLQLEKYNIIFYLYYVSISSTAAHRLLICPTSLQGLALQGLSQVRYPPERVLLAIID